MAMKSPFGVGTSHCPSSLFSPGDNGPVRLQTQTVEDTRRNGDEIGIRRRYLAFSVGVATPADDRTARPQPEAVVRACRDC